MVPLALIVTRTLPVPSVLAAVLAGDGIPLPGHGAEHAIACFNPHHRNDAAKAMRIDTVRGGYRCYGCGIRGNSWTYLTRIRGLQPRAAEALLTELGWPEEQFRWSRDRHEEQERVKSGAAKYMDEPRTTVGGRDGVPLARAIAQYYYRLADRRLVCVRYKYEGIHRRIPKCLTFTPSHRGGWWEALPSSTSVPAEDRHAGGLPLYRLSRTPGGDRGQRPGDLGRRGREVRRCRSGAAGHGLFQGRNAPRHMPVRRLPGKTRTMRPRAAAIAECQPSALF